MKGLFTRRTTSACLLALFAACALAGCAVPSFLSFKGDKVKWKQVTLIASDDVNGNSPVAVDVVLVTDDALVDRLTALPASKWFDGRADLVASFPKGLRYQSWELVPGQRLDVSGDTFDGTRVAGAFVFADYPQAGAHRVRIQQFSGTLVVQLDDTAFSVSDTK